MSALLAKNSGMLGVSLEMKTMQHHAARMQSTRAQAMGSCGRGGRVIEDAFHITVPAYTTCDRREHVPEGKGDSCSVYAVLGELLI